MIALKYSARVGFHCVQSSSEHAIGHLNMTNINLTSLTHESKIATSFCRLNNRAAWKVISKVLPFTSRLDIPVLQVDTLEVQLSPWLDAAHRDRAWVKVASDLAGSCPANRGRLDETIKREGWY